MSHLLPERQQLNLFPQHSWLRARRRTHTISAGADGRDIGNLLGAAQELLSKENARGYARPLVDVTLSDEVAQLALIPWQDRLRTRTQQTSYAEACLTERGVDLGRDWAICALFRRFGAPGLAVAVRRAHVEALMVLAEQRRLQLRSLLPFSARAYWSHRGMRAGQSGLLFLEEPNRVTALRYRGRQLEGIDIEPIMAAKPEHAISRLLRRASAYSRSNVIDYCSTGDTSSMEEFLVAQQPETTVKVLQFDALG